MPIRRESVNKIPLENKRGSSFVLPSAPATFLMRAHPVRCDGKETRRYPGVVERAEDERMMMKMGGDRLESWGKRLQITQGIEGALQNVSGGGTIQNLFAFGAAHVGFFN